MIMKRPLLLSLAFLLLGAALPAATAEPLRVCLVSGSAEYDSDTSLAAFQTYLEANYAARCVLLKARGFDNLPGLEVLENCDVALFFTRRLTIDGEQLERIKKYAASGKPIVAVRTASHGFQKWLEFDRLVLGGNYQNHLRNDRTTRAAVVPELKTHPVVDGIGVIASPGSLYKNTPIAEDATVLMVGTSPESKQPVAWVREYKGARVFYTSLGAQGDFENATFRRLLANALFWTARREMVRPEPPTPPTRPKPEGKILLTLSTRFEPFKGSGQWHELTFTESVPAAETAIVICDMWDKHWCRGATERCEAIAKKMAPVIKAARARGIQIVHCPSECMDFYADTPQRRRMMLAPKATPPKPLKIDEPPLPIDDSDGGCDTDDEMYLAWTRQNSNIDIGEYDGISDNGDEVYNLFRQLGIKNVIVMGVHTNMCVLGRSFAIREMTRRGMRCVLVRDLTDTMYDPKDSPHVSHDEGTELVVKHIEKYWCPSIESWNLIPGPPKDERP
jgi:nicotinamidase-related amidase/type 1 glutamine amidotransferase